jgi:CRP/FNR family cyclic AMP-dependent transcriptional regulator
MALIPDPEAFKQSLASLPIAVYVPGETVLDAGSTTGQLFILRKGVVEVVKNGLQIATVSEPGAVFGELSIILDKPHTADVRAIERSEFHVAPASTLLSENVAALLYVSGVLARRLDAANDIIVDVRGELDAGKQPGIISKALDRLEKLLSPEGGNDPNFHYYYPMY